MARRCVFLLPLLLLSSDSRPAHQARFRLQGRAPLGLNVSCPGPCVATPLGAAAALGESAVAAVSEQPIALHQRPISAAARGRVVEFSAYRPRRIRSALRREVLSPSTWDEAARPESLAVCCARAETPAAPPCSSIRSGLGRGCWSSSSAPYVSPQRISVEGRALHRFWRPESSPSRGRVFVASSVVCSIGTAAEVGAFVGSEHLGVPGRPSTPRPDSGASRIRVALQESPPERRIAGPSTASKRSR